MSDQGAAGSAILDPNWAAALLRARQLGVPASLRHACTEHRRRGDWQAACAAAAVDVRIDVADVRDRHGPAVSQHMLADLQVFAPDLLRWHLPRSLPDGGPQKNVVLSLAQYADGSTLAVSTPGSHWAAGERLVLDLLDRPPVGRRAAQWRLVRHRYLWDANRSSEYRQQAEGSGKITDAQDAGAFAEAWRLAGVRLGYRRGDRAFLQRLPIDLPRLRHEKKRLYGDSPVVTIRPGGARAIVLETSSYASGVDAYVAKADAAAGLPVMPRPAWCRRFDQEILRLGLASAPDLHPLIRPGPQEAEADQAVTIRCQGTIHRLRREGGRWIAPDHEVLQSDAEHFLIRLGAPASGCHQALAELDQARTAQKARFEATERYRSALAGTLTWPVPPDMPAGRKGPWHRPATASSGGASRGRRNTKPSIGAYIPPQIQRKGAHAETPERPW
jgi:hypothetical protein